MTDGNTIMTEELAAVAAAGGPYCNWSCPNTYGDFICKRAENHAGATVMIDVHVGYQADGVSLVSADPQYCQP